MKLTMLFNFILAIRSPSRVELLHDIHAMSIDSIEEVVVSIIHFLYHLMCEIILHQLRDLFVYETYFSW